MVALGLLGIMVFVNTLVTLKESLAVKDRITLDFRSIIQNYWSIVKNKTFSFNLLALSAVYFFLFSYIGGSSFVYQTEYGLSSEQFGLVFGLTSISLILGASSSAYFVKKMDITRLAMIGALVMMIGSITCITMYMLNMGLIGIVSGIALGLLEATLMAIAMDSQQTALGSCAALLGAIPMLLSSVATPIAGQLVEVDTLYWLVLLSAIGPLILFLVFMSARGASVKAFTH